MAKKKLGPSNDVIPECELVLAMALQNAGARDWKSIKGDFYNKPYDWDFTTHRPIPGPGTTACCFRGALFLEPDSAVYDDRYAGAGADGNNASDLDKEPCWTTDLDPLGAWRAGAAFEMALRDA